MGFVLDAPVRAIVRKEHSMDADNFVFIAAFTLSLYCLAFDEYVCAPSCPVGFLPPSAQLPFWPLSTLRPSWFHHAAEGMA